MTFLAHLHTEHITQASAVHGGGAHGLANWLLFGGAGMALIAAGVAAIFAIRRAIRAAGRPSRALAESPRR